VHFVAISSKQEEFRLGTDVEDHALFRQFGTGSFEQSARIFHIRRAVRQFDIANDSGSTNFFGCPRKNDIGIDIGAQVHVAFLDTGESFDGRTVKPYSLVDCLMQFGNRQIDALNGAEHIGEL